MSKMAVIQTGGKQYLVKEGDVLTVEKVEGAAGKAISFDNVLLVDDGKVTKTGAPFVKGAKVSGEIVEAGRAQKVTVVRYRPKSRYFKKRGHRQPYTKIKVNTIA
ncbi:MAG: 50S ribosomal protein L21 [Patescibacteria group bacterium]